MRAHEGRAPKERVWVRARPVPAWVPVLRETWKPQIKVRRVRYPAGHSLMPGWALSLGCLGSDPAGAAAARRRDPARSRSLGRALPAASLLGDSQLGRPVRKQARGTLCPVQGAARTRAPGRARSPQPYGRGRGPCSFLEAAPRGFRRALGPRRAGGLCPPGLGTKECPVPGLGASRREGSGRPKVRSALSARPA